MANTYFEVLQRASSFLEEQGIEGHSILFVFLKRKGWSQTDWLLNMKQEISNEEEKQLTEDLEKLAKHFPPQYLLGYEEFYGQKFIVNEHTLIPRPETEELVELCLQENTNEKKTVVDVGTGTGAIAISLKLARPHWDIIAVDISQKALEVAKKNAALLGATITFVHGNGLKNVTQPIDILISNPPYISENEWRLMDESVRTYEPKQALFAENDGLAIYQQLANEGKKQLKKNGKVYLEIGFQQGKAVKEIVAEAFPEKKVIVKKDLSGNDRMIVAS